MLEESDIQRKPRGFCRRHGSAGPCTCAMGNVYRFIEPVVMYLLLSKGSAHGYELAAAVQEHQLTDSEVDRGGLYRTLRALEQMGHVTSTWDVSGAGPARRVYSLTPSGVEHLREWIEVLTRMQSALSSFVGDATAKLDEADGRIEQRRTNTINKEEAAP